MSTRQHSAYIFARLHLHPSVATTEFDLWHRALATVACAPRYARFDDGLWLAKVIEPCNFDFEVRKIRCVLWYGVRPVRALLEITKWSEVECESSIRPLTHTWPVWTDGYARRVSQLVGQIVDALEGRVSVPNCVPDRPLVTPRVASSSSRVPTGAARKRGVYAAVGRSQVASLDLPA